MFTCVVKVIFHVSNSIQKYFISRKILRKDFIYKVSLFH